MNVLITNIEMDTYSGTTLYVKELALSLKEKQHNVQVFTFFIGDIAHELIDIGILVTNKLADISFTPDIIHSHHNRTTFKVLYYFKNTPALFWIHDRNNPYDFPPFHKNILKYMAVDYNCKERYSEAGFTDDQSEVIYNWVNLSRFKAKNKINATPKKALVFSNYANHNNYLSEIKSACNELNISIDTIGQGVGNYTKNPEDYLNNYDIVFGKAKAAMEAISTGAAVIVCDFNGLAGMVTLTKLNHFRKFNFGMKLMQKKITKENLIVELSKYKQSEIQNVTTALRDEIDLTHTTEKLLALYSNTIIDFTQKHKKGFYTFRFSNYLKIRISTIYDTVLLYLKVNFNPIFLKLQKIKKIL